MSVFLSFFLANPFIYLFYLYLSAYLYICLSIYGLYLSISLSLCLPVYLSICLTIYLCLYLSTVPLSHGSIFLSTYPSIHRSFYLSVHLSEYPYPSINLHSKIQWTDGRTGWILLLVTPSGVFFFGVKKMIREHSIRMPLRSCRTLLLDTWLMAFTTESFMAPKLANPKKIDNSFAPVLTWCCFGFFRVARRFCIALSSGNYSSWLASGQQQRGKNRSNLSHAQFSLPRAHISG